MKKNKHRSFFNERQLVLGLFALIAMVALMLASTGLIRSFTMYKRTKTVVALNEIATHSLSAVKHFAFERGRTTVVLKKNERITAENMLFIVERRENADISIEKVIHLSQSAFPLESSLLAKTWSVVKELRQEVDSNFEKQLEDRSETISTRWISSANELVQNIELLLIEASQLEDANYGFGRFANLRIRVLQFRNFVGSESSLLSGTILAGKIPNPTVLQEAEILRGRSLQLWSEIKSNGRFLENNLFEVSLDRVYTNLFEELYPHQEIFRTALRTGIPPALALDAYLESSVKALDSIIEMIDSLDSTANTYVAHEMYVALRSMIINIAGLFAILILYVLTQILLVKRFALPLKEIIVRTRLLQADSSENSFSGDTDLENVSYALDMLEKTLRELNKARIAAEHLADHDILTGLPTFRLASERLDIAMKSATRNVSKVGLLFIDLDGFKVINDENGHDAGDHVLQTVALRMKKTIRPNDTAARIGGDEFLVILPDLTNIAEAEKTAHRLLIAITEPISFNSKQLLAGASIGISIFPDHTNNAHKLQVLADKAMYSAKRSEKNKIVVYTV